jgi:hypothetical protein
LARLASDNKKESQAWELAAEISSLIDEGRWLFPNHHPNAYGQEKAKINHGFRDNRLDPLVEMYRKLMEGEVVDPSQIRKDFAFNIQELSLPLASHVKKDQ